MNAKVRIGRVEAKPGEKSQGYVDVADFHGYLLRLPVMIVNGSNDGPTLCLVAGVHACEYCGIETTMRVFRKTDPKGLSGAIIGVPLVNVPAFQAKTAYVNPLDGVDLSKAFSSSARERESSISYIIADTLVREIVLKADHLINFHGGDTPEENIDFVIVEEIGDMKVDEVSKKLGECFCPDYMWVKGKTPKGKRGLQLKGGLCEQANKAGIPAVMPEAGHSGKVQEAAVDFLLSGTLNVMRYLGMLDGVPRTSSPKEFYAQHLVKTRSAGFFRPLVELGVEVTRGQSIGHVRNIFGEIVEEVTSPVDGILDFLMFHASVSPGSVLMIIGEF
jgi:predicted deacylase